MNRLDDINMEFENQHTFDPLSKFIEKFGHKDRAYLVRVINFPLYNYL
jgi:hypothetical protein